ncbi:hypothetical protein SASPL_141104 [Salvia splendens]|uniref:Myb/SANT-like domain-containing protein n=1 Tax=Salvia splendens TaxID=180675 RepID=A0A8X8WR11_SALSN|nr:hypothetical protein SASPL_141104 [Salvia splendens]
MNPQIPTQATFFYQGKLNAAMDTLLLSTMIKLRTVSRSNDDTMSDMVLNKARKVIKLRFGSEITCADIVIRLELLRVRYQTFNDIVGTPGVRWNLDEKIIVADEATWMLYFGLATMFGLHDVKEEKSREVITIFDTTELIVITYSPVPNAPTHGRHVPSPADPDKVNSPFIDPTTRVRRKLFDETSTSTDRMSPSLVGGVVGSMAPNRYLPVKELYSLPKGSSCASWSLAAPSRTLAP